MLAIVQDRPRRTYSHQKAIQGETTSDSRVTGASAILTDKIVASDNLKTKYYKRRLSRLMCKVLADSSSAPDVRDPRHTCSRLEGVFDFNTLCWAVLRSHDDDGQFRWCM